MIILTGDDREQMEYYVRSLRNEVCEAIENDGDIANDIKVSYIYHEVRGLIHMILGKEGSEELDKFLETAKIRGLEARVRAIEKQSAEEPKV